ncbi:MAG TPA: 2-oxo-4-hydroxy-4-carboxy-5-ureidoimidazoline decarboxylase [Acidobacteriaceae bacterium]|nr:2-oxo-4-hydroxy-4-carboxy-5-ureidoimidazoline decarboxylase [Acidobacteriaceae bacterium]
MTIPSQDDVLARWNTLDAAAAAREILPCCGSRAWAKKMAALRPIADPEQMFATSDQVWAQLPAKDWQEAFDSHPRIGQRHARRATLQSLAWSRQEQQAIVASGAEQDATTLALAQGNRQYEDRFGRIFIVCASGKSAAEILAILNARLHNTVAMEWFESGEQQRQIAQLRLRRWLGAE